jgi:putative membrane protein
VCPHPGRMFISFFDSTGANFLFLRQGIPASNVPVAGKGPCRASRSNDSDGTQRRRTDVNKRIAIHSSLNGPRGALVALALSAMVLAPLTVHAGDTGQADPTKLTDANIAAMVLAANTIDIKNGELAIAKSKSHSVREFAKQMVTDHTSVNGKAAALAARLQLVPNENQASRDLVANTDSTRKQMRKLSGAAFDRAYVKNEVAYHQAVIDLLDTTLVPGAQNKDLKDLLIAVRPAFVAHLDHAKMIQASFVK